MIRHPLTLDLIARELQALLKGAKCATAWIQEKRQATLGFVLQNGEEVYVHLSVAHDYGTVLLSSTPNRAKKNSLDLFPELIGKTVRWVARQEADRIITFQFDEIQLHALFFSANSGNIVLVRGDTIIDALQNKKTLIGTPFSISTHELLLGPYLSLIQEPYESTIEAYKNSKAYYLLKNDSATIFSAVPIPGWNIEAQFTDLFQALRTTVGRRRNEDSTKTIQNTENKKLSTQLAKIERTLAALETDATKASSPDSLRTEANTLLSSASVTKEQVRKANTLFQKARTSETAAEERQKRKSLLLNQRDELVARIALLATNVLPTTKLMIPQQEKQAPYRIFMLDDGYVLYVGRNSANNDQLTMKFAKQQDYWLHVRGQSGSHCVLRSPVPTSHKPPKAIIEQAAAIAAYYSSARNAGWVPVVYTQRKYVRKPKGAAVGAVTLEREEVVMAKPGLPSAQQE